MHNCCSYTYIHVQPKHDPLPLWLPLQTLCKKAIQSHFSVMHVVWFSVIRLSLLCSMCCYCCHVSCCTAQMGQPIIICAMLQSGSEPWTTMEACAGTLQAMCCFSQLFLDAASSQSRVSKLVFEHIIMHVCRLPSYQTLFLQSKALYALLLLAHLQHISCGNQGLLELGLLDQRWVK